MSRLNLNPTDLLMAGVAWLIVVLKMRNIRQSGRWTTDRLALSVWAFGLFFAISMTFQIEPLFTWFDKVTFNNLSWFLSYSTLAIAICVIVTAMLNSLLVMQAHDPRSLQRLKYFLVCALIISGILYIGSVSRLPENIGRDTPASFTELLFMETMYLYGVCLCLFSVSVFFRHTKIEEIVSTRIRTLAMLTVSFLALLAFSDKVLITILEYIHPGLYTHLLLRIYNIILLSGGLVWLSVFLPNRLYMFLARPWITFGDWLIYRDLKILPVRLDRIYPCAKTPDISIWEFIRNPHYHLYRTLVNILDCRAMLSDLLTRENINPSVSGWDTNKRQQAELFNQGLQAIQIEDDFWDMVRAYRGAAHKINHLKFTGNQEDALS